MSPLPERRKTPEELAALRQSLGIPSSAEASPEESEPPADGEPEPDPSELEPAIEPVEAGRGDDLSAAESEPVSTSKEEGEEVIRVGEPKPVRSLRKSAGLAVDRPKMQRSRGDDSIIPARRHSDQELKEIRRASEIAPPVGELIPKRAHPATLVVLYGLSMILLSASILGSITTQMPSVDLPFDWLVQLNRSEHFPIILFCLLCASGGGLLLSAGWLALCRPLSRHHAGIMTIIAVLVLVFGTLYFFPELHAA